MKRNLSIPPHDSLGNYPILVVYLLIMIFPLLESCSISNSGKIQEYFNVYQSNLVATHHFTGICVFDPVDNKIIYQYNADKYFTPASNVKIFTLYTALSLLPDSIPSVKYAEENDTVIIMPLGDPSLLHPYFLDSTLIDFISEKQEAHYYFNHFRETPYGPGWAWEDHDQYYSPERSALPLFGNVVTIQNSDSTNITPARFISNVSVRDTTIKRSLNKNRFFYNSEDTLISIPFITSDSLAVNMLSEIAKVKGLIIDALPYKEFNILYSIASDSLYKRMMVESDNFLAEQMLILSSSMIGDTLSTSRAIKYATDSLLHDLINQPRWVDGSGLSRYNLTTPASLVTVLKKLFIKVPQKRLLNFFPKGGISATLKDDFKTDVAPFLFAKSGSLGNNYNLSGYLVAKSGKILIFSIMNNHFMVPSSEIKSQINEFLYKLYLMY